MICMKWINVSGPRATVWPATQYIRTARGKLVGPRDSNNNNDEYLRVKWLTLVCKKARLLLTFSILWTRIRPLLGLANFSPEMISSSLSSFLPSARSTNRSSTSMRACHSTNHFNYSSIALHYSFFFSSKITYFIFLTVWMI